MPKRYTLCDFLKSVGFFFFFLKYNIIKLSYHEQSYHEPFAIWLAHSKHVRGKHQAKMTQHTSHSETIPKGEILVALFSKYLAGTPVPLHIHSLIQSANHVAGEPCINPCRYRPRASVNVHVEHHNLGGGVSMILTSLTMAWKLVQGWDLKKLLIIWDFYV